MSMNTIKLKEAIRVIAQGGFIKSPSNHFSTHTSLCNKDGIEVGRVTQDCYFEVMDCLHGLWTHGNHMKGEDYMEKVHHYSTIKGNFKQLNKVLEMDASELTTFKLFKLSERLENV
jgi:hypothetical protein